MTSLIFKKLKLKRNTKNVNFNLAFTQVKTNFAVWRIKT